jgi:glutamate--cysteine ligase
MYEELFKKKKNQKLLKKFRCGIERETLRINSKGNLSQTPHPLALGSPLTHPHIGTDFGEAQLEWNTPALTSFASAENFLRNIMSFSAKHLKNELFWPFSMPCPLSKIDIARYGTSYAGQNKEIYREGLKHRYGMNLQMISSIHFNFSFSQSFWDFFHKHEQSRQPLREFISEKYLHLIRNFLREGWLLTYLFGSSPAMDRSYMKTPSKDFKKIGTQTFYAPWATSIRMSHLGYYSRIQNQQAISFNDLKSYLSEMHYAISTPKKDYQNIPLQLNSNLLQIENEHYSRIRPKAIPKNGETPLQALENRGIEYVEVRSIDLDPYHPIGISREHLFFHHLFLLYCLFKPSPKLHKEAQIRLTCDQNLVALKGRKKGVLLTNGKSLQSEGKKILRSMEQLACFLGYEKTLDQQIEKIKNSDSVLSAKILSDIKKEGLQKMGISLAKSHKKTLLLNPLSPKQLSAFKTHVQTSLIENKRLETVSKVLVKDYEDLEISTQILIREALKRKIKIEVLDRKDNFLKLTKNGKEEYVKQATKTSRDSYIVPHIFENKYVTKKLLSRKGFRVPYDKLYTTVSEAMKDAPLYYNKKVVVKPKSTNFGVGITFIDKGQKSLYRSAIEYAFSYGDSVLVEDYHKGKEFRFLVINKKVIGVVKREPANVVGDGKHTIKQLVHIKNYDPSFYRDPKTHLHLGEKEKQTLRSRGLNPSSTLKKGKKIFLRQNSNVSTGGDAIDMTDKVHPEYKRIASQASQALNAKICGVDIMIASPMKAPTETNYAIIELNYNPVLFIHAYPYKGKGRNVAGPLLDLIFET